MNSNNIPQTLSRILSQFGNGSKTRKRDRDKERMLSVRIYKAITWFVGNDRAMRRDVFRFGALARASIANTSVGQWRAPLAHRRRAPLAGSGAAARIKKSAAHVRRAIWRARASPSTLGCLRPMIAERALLFSGTQGTFSWRIFNKWRGRRWARATGSVIFFCWLRAIIGRSIVRREILDVGIRR